MKQTIPKSTWVLLSKELETMEGLEGPMSFITLRSQENDAVNQAKTFYTRDGAEICKEKHRRLKGFKVMKASEVFNELGHLREAFCPIQTAAPITLAGHFANIYTPLPGFHTHFLDPTTKEVEDDNVLGTVADPPTLNLGGTRTGRMISAGNRCGKTAALREEFEHVLKQWDLFYQSSLGDKV